MKNINLTSEVNVFLLVIIKIEKLQYIYKQFKNSIFSFFYKRYSNFKLIFDNLSFYISIIFKINNSFERKKLIFIKIM